MRLHLLAPLRTPTRAGQKDGDIDGAHEERQHEGAERDDQGRPETVVPVLHLVDDAEQFETHQQEDRALEDELHCAPVLAVREAVLRRKAAGGAVAGDQPGDDGRHETGCPEQFSRDGGEEGHREGDDRVDRRIRHFRTHPEVQVADDETENHGDRDGVEEAAEHAPERDRCRGGRDGRPQEHESGRVVQETLALEHSDHPAPDADPLHDRRRHRIRRAHDRAERDTPPDAETRDHPGEEETEHDRRDDDECDRQAADGVELAAEVHGRHLDGGRIQERGKDAREDQLRTHVQGRHERQQADRDAEDDEDDRGRDPEARRESGRGRDDEQPGDGDDQRFDRLTPVRAHPWSECTPSYGRVRWRRLPRSLVSGHSLGPKCPSGDGFGTYWAQ